MEQKVDLVYEPRGNDWCLPGDHNEENTLFLCGSASRLPRDKKSLRLVGNTRVPDADKFARATELEPRRWLIRFYPDGGLYEGYLYGNFRRWLESFGDEAFTVYLTVE